ncbi:MAG: hypothetical protein KF735_12420 [Chelatococcus sp.]|jgi:hypothetical protein|uniref:hypothetical protein n=1 Tax=unclassified Chelatococcus TaxID=2638111 RepID=UPI001BCE9046|nr:MULTISPECIES: hypothetical protein [unclassified Chelatococcus]CAH1654379.1 conserved hypothetical protein [Hyphomicrobiales bacterium]MBS7742791.1 hypothetical protein [Chelatococcus sp. HY11]MBX3538443.1 hypothetical protein [Chelatococcus sp.]MBX3542091.1 hypothetical protein [Chelatococcus sp.]MCO5075693.1 hypothetical protein [Chelatococcus sp.]
MTERPVELAFQQVSAALDEIGEEQEKLFLARLVLILSSELGESARVGKAIRRARDGLDLQAE